MRPAALMYHDVIGADGVRGGFEGAGAAVYAVTAAEFERQMDGIERALETPPLLTFDDGGASAAGVGESLARRGWSAHFFVVTARVGTPGFLSWEEIRALASQGHAIGSHSHTHPERIGELSVAELHEEWGRSVAALSEALGARVTTASVPGGDYSEAVGRAAAEAGIETLFTSEPRREPQRVGSCTLIGRYAVRGSTPTDTAIAAAAGAAGPWRRQLLGWTVRGWAKRLGGRRYERLRRALLRRRGNGPAARTPPRG